MKWWTMLHFTKRRKLKTVGSLCVCVCACYFCFHSNEFRYENDHRLPCFGGRMRIESTIFWGCLFQFGKSMACRHSGLWTLLGLGPLKEWMLWVCVGPKPSVLFARAAVILSAPGIYFLSIKPENNSLFFFLFSGVTLGEQLSRWHLWTPAEHSQADTAFLISGRTWASSSPSAMGSCSPGGCASWSILLRHRDAWGGWHESDSLTHGLIQLVCT